MKRIFCLVAIGLGLGACVLAGTRRLSQIPPVSATTAPGRGTYTNEQEWIISEIANAIVNMAAFARHESDAGAPTRVTDRHAATASILAGFAIAHADQQYPIDITEHLWAPEAFVSLARRLIGPATASVPPDGRLLIEALTNPTAGVIQSENVRVSRLLAEQPRSSALHEQAALLLGALALRENAAILSDPRVMMARMTAHLAVARALSSDGATLAGRLADAVLLTLVNRQRDALAHLDAIDRSDPSPMVRAWTRALRVRISKDWRLVATVKSASLLEQRETLRAAHLVIGDGRSLPMLDLLPRTDLADWGRIILHKSPTVEGGNRFADTAVALELRDAFVVIDSFEPSFDQYDRQGLVRALNAEPQPGPASFGASPQFWIIDRGLWAASSQRHLMASLVCTSRHYRKMLGLQDEATAMTRKYQEAFGELRLFPLVAYETALDTENVAEYTAAVAAAAALVRAHPALVTDMVWTELHQKREFAPPPVGVPPSLPWFAPYFPAGTAFEPSRVYTTGFHVRVDLPQIETLKAIAPAERDFVLRYIDLKFGPNPGVDVLRREIGSLADYDSPAAWKIARAAIATPAVYLPLVRHLADTMDPGNWYWVAQYLAEHGQNDAALAAFERYRHEARDQVAISDRSDWFVKLLIRDGRRAQALELAKESADVGSYDGLTGYADALDMGGETGRAERLYRNAADRYYSSRDGSLLAFLQRHRTDAAYAGEARELAGKVFPKGQEAVSALSMTGAPDGGLRVALSGVLGEQNGVHQGDVIVAVDGTRVHDLTQYRALKFQSWHPEMRFVVWRGGKSLEVPTRLRHRWIASSLKPYYPGL